LQRFFNLLVISLMMIGWTDLISTPPQLVRPALAQTPAKAIAVVFPPVAQVFLKAGASKSGRLTAIDLGKQQITITRGNQSASIPIAQIAKVRFLDEDLAPNLTPTIRGGEPRTWQGIPLNNLKLKDTSRGRAEVTLPPGVEPKPKPGIYVIEGLEFGGAGKVTIRVSVE
jgi:hypothetical protein